MINIINNKNNNKPVK